MPSFARTPTRGRAVRAPRNEPPFREVFQLVDVENGTGGRVGCGFVASRFSAFFWDRPTGVISSRGFGRGWLGPAPWMAGSGLRPLGASHFLGGSDAGSPGGTTENSPVLQHWVRGTDGVSPGGTKETALLPSLRDSFVRRADPVLKHWAILGRPGGTARPASLSILPLH